LEPGDLRALRPVRLLPVGGPGGRPHRRLPRRAALRPGPCADLAAAHRCPAGALRRDPRHRGMSALHLLDDFGFEAAAIVLGPSGERERRGEVDRVRPWRSVTKALTGFGAAIAAQEGRVGLDDAAGPPGSTLRHLLSHASGYFYESA